MELPAPALGRRARVEQPDTLVALDERQVRVTEDHGPAAAEPCRQPLLAPGRRTRVVGHPEPRALHLQDELLRQKRPERRLVGVAVDGFHGRAERPELLEHGQRREVAAVEDQIRRVAAVQTFLGELSGSPRKVRIGDDCDRGHRPRG